MKSQLAIAFAEQAAEQDEAAKVMLASSDFEGSRKTQALFIVGAVTANVLQALADQVDFLAQTGAIDEVQARRAKLDEVQARRAKLMEKNNAIRLAAASGNWERFDELVDDFGTPGGDES